MDRARDQLESPRLYNSLGKQEFSFFNDAKLSSSFKMTWEKWDKINYFLKNSKLFLKAKTILEKLKNYIHEGLESIC